MNIDNIHMEEKVVLFVYAYKLHTVKVVIYTNYSLSVLPPFTNIT